MSITISKGLGFQNGRQLRFVRSPNIGGKLRPEYIVIHDTASGLTDSGDVSWLTNPAAKVSAHVVVARDGRITQLVPFNVVAWHAGQSVWKGRKFLNGFAIGIEIDNPGKLQKVADGVYKSAVCTIDTNKDPSLVVKYAKTAAHGAGYWLMYSDAQIEAVKELCAAICAEYQISDIVTHWMISPGRKIDTNPLYPLDDLRNAVLRRHQLGFADLSVEPERTDTDEGGEEPVTLDPPEAKRDESAGGVSKIKALIKSKLTWGGGAFSSLTLSSFTGLLTDWRVIVALGVFILIAFAIFLWIEKD
ncbi:N-acetylmuramoyl-L-alanine amidase [Rhodopseudomonas palustris]|uniref:N-acetylmuramoyl-L-alanine amidase n=1 Tax=Rhodopseudomonas palustris TaxID=1076 RepID=UPI000641BE6E|nr:N-acetylmuramoyl-L-alanine amidase [Rhodopseudomonas palustris]